MKTTPKLTGLFYKMIGKVWCVIDMRYTPPKNIGVIVPIAFIKNQWKLCQFLQQGLQYNYGTVPFPKKFRLTEPQGKLKV